MVIPLLLTNILYHHRITQPMMQRLKGFELKF